MKYGGLLEFGQLFSFMDFTNVSKGDLGFMNNGKINLKKESIYFIFLSFPAQLPLSPSSLRSGG